MNRESSRHGYEAALMDSVRRQCVRFVTDHQLHLLCLATLLSLVAFPLCARATVPAQLAMVTLPGEVVPLLSRATRLPSSSGAARQELRLTVVLKREHQAELTRYLHELYDPNSGQYRHFLTETEISDRFGPSGDDYAQVAAYLRARGFRLVVGSQNRLTLTFEGTRAAAEQAFGVKICDYQFKGRRFYANSSAPMLPAPLATHVQDIAGLSDLARPHHDRKAVLNAICSFFEGICKAAGGVANPTELQKCRDAANAGNSYGSFYFCGPAVPSGSPLHEEPLARAASPKATSTPVSWGNVTGAGQKIGLLEFDTFSQSDVVNYLAFFGKPATTINNLSKVDVNGGVTTPGTGQDEVLLDIDISLSIAPGAQTVVFDSPFAGPASFQAVLNAMLNNKVTIVSNSWAYCEDEGTAADAQGIDAIFQTAAVAGVSVFNGSGDSGSACLDGSPNTVAVPADSPNATAVGGSSLQGNANQTYGPEAWWNDSNTTPPAGVGGFGLSKIFPVPGYQVAFNTNPNRSIPDVVVNADPFQGISICEAAAGGCPNGLLYGGTSAAAPTWAAFTALLNQARGVNLGFLNPQIYPLSNSGAFHTAAALGSDFAHVGLGSPNLNQLYLMLSGSTVGAVNPTTSAMALQLGLPANGIPPTGIPADGQTAGTVTVWLRDANGNNVGGKTVTLTANSGTGAQISPANVVTSPANGAASFRIVDPTAENVTVTAIDSSDNITLSQSLPVNFTVPAPASANISSAPGTVVNDGVTASVISVMLVDGLNRPTPGKQIALTQTGNSVISGSGVTNSSGEAQFSVVDTTPESVTYTAVDITDGNLPVPGSAVVTFTGSPTAGCGTGTPPAAPGFLVKPYVTGFLPQTILYGNISFGCWGAAGLAFDQQGNLYVNYMPNGSIYKFPAGGGVVGPGTLLTSTPLGPSLIGLAIDKLGNLYVSRAATTGNFNTGAVFQINPTNGATIQTVASNLTCPTALAADPLSGDLFTDDSCSGAGADNPALWRISNPSGASPQTSVYLNFPATPNDNITFTPSGQMYAWADDGVPRIAQISGTNGPNPPLLSIIPNIQLSALGILAAGMQSDGAAQTVFVNPFDPTNNVALGTAGIDLTGNPPGTSVSLVQKYGANSMTFGPDGCIYAAQFQSVYKITDLNGGCNYAAASQPATLTLTPVGVSPNPAQGSAQSFTATFHYTTVPDGTPVWFNVAGANPQVAQVSTAGGAASFTYTASHSGIDTIVASSSPTGTPLTSNQAVVTWATGTDVTFLSLNGSPSTGTAGQPITVAGNLTDVSVKPATPLVGQSIMFTVGSTSCSADTDSNGNASCQINPAGSGTMTLAGSFSGTSQYNAATASQSVNLLAPTPTPSAIPSPSPTPTASPSPTPTAAPTATPSASAVPPTATAMPTATGTAQPTAAPTQGSLSTDFTGTAQTLTGKAGTQVTMTFTATNQTGAAETVNSITVGLGNPGLLSALNVSAGSQTAQAPTSLGTSNLFTFSPALSVAAGGALTFTVTGTIAGQVAMNGPTMRFARMTGQFGPATPVVCLAGLAPSSTGASGLPGLLAGLALIGLVTITRRGQMRLRAIAGGLVLAGLLAAAASGCGSSNSTNYASTTVAVTAAQASGAGGMITGLPLQIGVVRRPQ